jgi:hypothetical protein
MIRKEIDIDKASWFVFADGSMESKKISSIMSVLQISQETECLTTVTSPSSICNIFRITKHAASLIISDREMKQYQLYFREEIEGFPKIAIPIDPESATWLLEIRQPDEKSKTYKNLINKILHAKYGNEVGRLLSAIGLKEITYANKGIRTFKACDLLEKYKKMPTVAKLIGVDKVTYDYLSSKSYVLQVRKRLKQYSLWVVSYPKVHVIKPHPRTFLNEKVVV